MTMDRKFCSGCVNNFYNGFNDLGVTTCWSLKTAKRIKRKKVPLNQVPPWNQPAQMLPSCYRQRGYAIIDGNPTR